jgi:HK97 family phage major capsid protein
MPSPKQRHLTISLTREAVDEAARTVQIAVSSETPVPRWGCMEILEHTPEAVDLTRFQDGAAFLLDHDPTRQVGVIEQVALGADRVLRAVVRFGRSALAQEAFQDVMDAIKTKISVGYSYDEADVETSKDATTGTLIERVKRWIPMEASLVAIPADATVGVGRSLPEPEVEVEDPASPEDPDEEEEDAPDESGITTADEAANQEGLMDPKDTKGGQNAATVEELRTASASATTRATEILALCQTFGLTDRAAELIGSERSTMDIKAEILADAQKRLKPMNAAGVKLNDREVKAYSYARAIFSLVAQQEGRDYSCFEREVSQDLERAKPVSYQARGGIFVPMQKRAGMDSITATKGKELIFEQFGGELIQLLRNKSVITQMGARVFTGLTGPLRFPRQTAAAQANWMAENGGADTTASNLTLDSVTLSPKTLMATTSFSRQLEALGVVDAENLVVNDLALVVALAWDLAALHGTGTSNQPTGIYNTAGVNSTAMGGVPTYGKLQDMITAVANANALFGSLGFLTTPGMAGKMAQTLVAAAAGSKMIWEGPYDGGVVNGYKGQATNQVSSTLGVSNNEHGIIFGNFNDLLVGQFGGGMELIVDPYALKKQGMIEITAFQMVDIATRHAKSFSVATGATLA